MYSPFMTDATPPRTQRNRSRILAAAQSAFLSTGYEQTSMDTVSTAAGVSKQTVYAHFGSKETLFIAMTDAMIDEAVAAQSAVAPDPGPGIVIADWLFDHARAQLNSATNRSLMQLWRVAIAEAERLPQVGAAVFEAGPAQAIARLGRIFAAWHDSGQLNAPDSLRAAAVFNWLIMGGPISEAMLLGAARSDSPGTTDAHAMECVRVFLAAYERG